MNIEMENTDWHKVNNLTNESVYFIQGKYEEGKNWFERTFLYTQATEKPTNNKKGFLTSSIKFDKKAGKEVYIRALQLPCNIHIEEV